MGQKCILEPLFSEIQLNIENFSSLELIRTSGCVAKWLQRLGQIPIAFEKFELSRVQFPAEEHDFFFFVQIHYFVLFMYESMPYIDKQGSKVLGGLLLITLNF